MVKDDTSSLLWLRDAESCYSERSAFEENSELLDTTFDFDQEVFKSKAYLEAMRSNMKHELASRTSPELRQRAYSSGIIMDTNDLLTIDNDADDEDAATIREPPTSSWPLNDGHTVNEGSQTCAQIDAYTKQPYQRKRLALQLFLVKGFKLYSFQLRNPKELRISIYCHYLALNLRD